MSKNEENKIQADGQISSSDPLSFMSPLLVRNAWCLDKKLQCKATALSLFTSAAKQQLKAIG